MKLSFSCPSCGKKFRVKPELVGRKAKCQCGSVVRLGEKKKRSPKNRPKAISTPEPESPNDLLEVDLMGLEMLGDQLLGGDLLGGGLPDSPNSSRESTVPRAEDSARRGSERNAKRKTKSKKQPKTTRKSKPTVPQVPLTVSAQGGDKPKLKSKSERSPRSKKPKQEANYDDLDAILAGAGDASPLVIPPPEPVVNEETLESSASSRNTAATIGFLASLASATLAFWFGLFVAGSKFQLIDWFLLENFSRHLHSVYSGAFPAAQVSTEGLTGVYQFVFVGVGWLLLGVAVAMVFIGAGQFINAFFKLMTGVQPLRWFEGLAATAGVVAVLLLIALVFCQTSFAMSERRLLNDFEQPMVEAGGQLDNVTELRKIVDDRNRSFTSTFLFAATVPIGVFCLSMVRLFINSTQDDRRDED